MPIDFPIVSFNDEYDGWRILIFKNNFPPSKATSTQGVIMSKSERKDCVTFSRDIYLNIKQYSSNEDNLEARTDVIM